MRARAPEVLLESYTVIRETWLSRFPSRAGAWWATATTLFLFAGSWVYWSNFRGWADQMPASRTAIFDNHQYFRLWTALFAHADPAHLFSNSILFFILGFALAGYFGAKAFPGAALLWGGVINGLSVWSYPADTRLIGASGVVFWMGGAWLTLGLLLDRRRSRGSRVLRSGGVALALFMPAEAFDPTVSYRTHLIGFAGGVLWAAFLFLRKKETFRSAEKIETVLEAD